MDIFPLNIFPASSLASSVVTTVWVGIAVVAFFNLRLGWTLSGLVVPGYLVPLLILKPWSAAVVFVEGLVTYLIVWQLFERMSKIGVWGSIFGRDRFFALILVSIGVRILFDGWLWPSVGIWANDFLALDFDYRNNLQSFGLVIIALMANQYWKTGVLRGLLPNFVIILVVYLIIRYVFMPYTNFTISNVGYMYEDIASSILASPKAYIILLCTALVASRMNLLYGWDFSGILIPSLLALQWYEPVKILTSFAEAFIILITAHLLLKTSIFKNVNIEGARKLLLFFNIGFVYKIILAYFLLWFFPDVKVTDTYAFGYLLATLLAVKMHDKDIAARMTRATLQTSIAGVIFASMIGFALTLLPVGLSFQVSADSDVSQKVKHSSKDLVATLLQDKVRFYGTIGAHLPVALPQELELFSAAMSELKLYRSTKDTAHLTMGASYLAQINFSIEIVEGKYLHISEKNKNRGWGSYVLNINNNNGLLISVPKPLEEHGALEASEVIFKVESASAMAVAGSRSDNNPDQSSSVLVNPSTMFHVFHRSLARNDILQVRAYSPEIQTTIMKTQTISFSKSLIQFPTRLWVKGSLPAGLDLPFIKDRAGTLDIEWGDSPFSNRQRDAARQGFAELLLNPTTLRKIRAYSVYSSRTSKLQVHEQRIDGFMLEWILSSRQSIAARGSEQYTPPTLEQLLFFDEEVVTPLLDVMKREYRAGKWSKAGKLELNLINSASAVMGYEVLQYRHRESQQDFIVLHESQQSKVKHWGTYVFRLGASNNYMVQAPRPLYEYNSFEYAVALFERLGAFTLSIAGTNPNANRNGSSDLVQMRNIRSLFSMVNQAVLREANETPMMVIHSRSRGYRADVPMITEDVLISYYRDSVVSVDEDELSQSFLQILKDDGVSIRYMDGSIETSGYEVTGVAQSKYLSASKNNQFWALWVSPSARAEYRQQTENKQEIGRFTALGISTLEKDLSLFLKNKSFSRKPISSYSALLKDIERYLVSQNVISLRNIQRVWTQFKFFRLLDRDSRQSFLLVLDKKRAPFLVVNLNPRNINAKIIIKSKAASHADVNNFLNQRAAWLLKGSKQ